jgi:NADH-quinone oxidoreductase subunit C
VTAWVDRVREVYVDRVDVRAEPVAVDVSPQDWVDAVRRARDALGCSFFDWLSAVDEARSPGGGKGAVPADEGGIRLVCHLAAHRPGSIDHLVVRTMLPREAPLVASVAEVFAGARWHERETHEMFGVVFTEVGEALPLEPLLLPAEFEGHPLRKDFVLASRVVKEWPGGKEPGESESTPVPTRSRRRARPLGVPDPGTWGTRG